MAGATIRHLKVQEAAIAKKKKCTTRHTRVTEQEWIRKARTYVQKGLQEGRIWNKALWLLQQIAGNLIGAADIRAFFLVGGCEICAIETVV